MNECKLLKENIIIIIDYTMTFGALHTCIYEWYSLWLLPFDIGQIALICAVEATQLLSCSYIVASCVTQSSDIIIDILHVR